MSTASASGTPAGRRRFWITVLCFALVNAGLWAAWLAVYGPTRRDLLRVEAFEPGENSIVGARPAIRWRFNLEVGTDGATEPPGRIEPFVPGRWKWVDGRTLAFVLDEDLPKATRFTLHLSNRLRTAEGFYLGRGQQATFRTPPLGIVTVSQVGTEDGDRFVMAMEFNDRVVPADVLKRLRLSDREGKPVEATLLSDAAGEVVRVRTGPLPLPGGEQRTLTVRLEPGLTGAAGPLGMEEPYQYTLMLDHALAITQATGFAPGQGDPHIQLQANREMDLQALREVISVEPEAAFELESSWRGVILRGGFAPGTRYTVKIGKAPSGADLARYPRPDTLSVLVPDRQGSVWFEHDEGYLGAHGNRTLLAHAVNVQGLKVSAWRVYDNNLVAWRNNDSSRYSWGQTDAFSQPVATRIIEGSSKRNEVQDIRIGLDELLPPEAQKDGVYRIQLSAERGTAPDDEEDNYYGSSQRNQSAVATLSDIGLTAKCSSDTVTAWAVSLSSGRPLANVRVRVYSNKSQVLGEGRTDADGLATVRGIRPAEWESAAVVLADIGADDAATQGWPAAVGRAGAWLSGVVASQDAAPATQPAARVGLTWLDLREAQWKLPEANLSGRPYLRQGYEAFIFTERGAYRPGETVHLRAIVRGTDATTPKPFPVRWTVRRPDLREYRSETVMLDADGAASFDLPIPEDLPTGRWTAVLGLPGDAKSQQALGTGGFHIEDFVPDRIKVGLTLAGVPADQKAPRIAVGKKPLEAAVQADYLFGRPAAGLQAGLRARLDPVAFNPSGWSGWTFGDAASLCDAPGASAVGAVVPEPVSDVAEDEEELALDDKGHATWKIDLRELLKMPADEARPTSEYLGPWRLAVAAEVRETGGRAVSTGQSVLIDALPHYIAIRPATTGLPRPNAPFKMDLSLVKPDGQLADAAARLEVSVFRITWNTTLVKREGGRYTYQSTRVLDPVDKAAVTEVAAKAGRGEIALRIPNSGEYAIRLRDKRTGAIASRSFYITDGNPWNDNISRENPERLEIAILPGGAAPSTQPAEASSSTSFRVGQQATALVRSPFAGRLLVTIETDQVVTAKVLEMTASQMSIPIDITEALRPNAYISATVVRHVEPNAPWRTHRAFGVARLAVDPADRALALTIMGPTDIRPRTPLPVSVRIADGTGKPIANAAVTLCAVDEGILQLTRYKTPDPLGFFNAGRALGVGSGDIYSMLMPEVAKPDAISSVGGDGADKEDLDARHRSPVKAKRVKPVSLISPVLHTDADGIAQWTAEVPEFAGNLRVMAIAHRAEMFGSTEKPTLVRSPLLVQSSYPRFAAPGDRFQAPLVVFNNGSAAGEAKLVVELVEDGPAATPLLSLKAAGATEASPRRLELAPIRLDAGGQAAALLEMTAGQACGVAKIRLTGTTGTETFEENVELPIRPASPAIVRGGYLAAGGEEPAKLTIPGGLLSGTEMLDVRLTPWPALELPGGLDYLERYPYGCAEQTISTCIPLVYLSDIGRHIAPGVFEKERVDRKVQAGILRLLGMQTAEGGIAMWAGSRETWPWASVYAAHFLVEAEAAGHKVPEDFRRQLLSYVRGLLSRELDGGDALELQAYACYVLALSGSPQRTTMSRLAEVADGPEKPGLAKSASQRVQARLLLSLAWMSAGRKDVAASLIPQAIPSPRQGRQLSGNIGSPIRDRALVVSAMVAVQPDHPALPVLVQQLADSIRQGRWRSTQDAAFATMAIGRYLRQAKAEQPYTSAELWHNGAKVAAADAAKTLAHRLDLRGGAIAPGALAVRDFEVRLAGGPAVKGHLSWIQSGVPVAPPADEDNGMKVRRWYLTEDGKPLASTTLPNGQLIRVAITIEGPAADNIVIEDLFPAGLEIENPRLMPEVVVEARARPARRAEPTLDVQRMDIRDDRLILVAHMPYAGTVRHEYLARAVTPGTFIVPPVRGECMYDVGVNSISGGGGTITVIPAGAAATSR